MSGWLVEQLIASTLYNLSVLHLWNEEYDMALQYSRKCIRTKIENAGDNVLMMVSLFDHTFPPTQHILSHKVLDITAHLGQHRFDTLCIRGSHVFGGCFP